MIVSFRDLFFTGQPNSNGLVSAEYPAKKPKNTYRIIIAGDSRTMEVHDYPFQTDLHPQPVTYFPPNFRFAPQVEQELNFQAALDGVPLNYEVFNCGRHGDLLFWPTFDLPEVVKRNDVDLVIIFNPQNDLRPYNYYFDHPLTSDGIPKYPNDIEYYLKPPLERIPNGLPRKFYDFCKAHDLVKIDGRNFKFDDSKILSDPALHDMVLDFYGKPLDVLNRELSSTKTSGGKPVRLLVLFTYTGREWNQQHDSDLWIEAAKKFNFPFLDLNPEMNALHLSFFPLTQDDSHFNPDGSVFFGRLLACVLVRDKLIPWNEDSNK